MPNLKFPADEDLAKGKAFCGTVVEHGVIIHPRHNWFLSAAHTDRDVERALEATWAGFQAVRARFGED
jgi:glutamate-1-semialdehyde 2,1-aminomutase